MPRETDRCASALTHPATVAAIALLLVNDILFKQFWPHPWVTGKISDFAWMVFAPPLLAFLLGFAASRSAAGRRAAFLAAYAGLPLLYAAFNTFAPVHDWILRGLLFISDGTAGSPLDVADSLVIPIGLGAALAVWRRPPAGAQSLRLRWSLLAACVAALASVASSPDFQAPGITSVGVSQDGAVCAATSRTYETNAWRSNDGG
ncbi:MAG: hypothetical protein J4F32_03990 [Dehalococcoidia bacterium]|nr:hypothetical protein [Dehalococcoidia bacterium]